MVLDHHDDRTLIQTVIQQADPVAECRIQAGAQPVFAAQVGYARTNSLSVSATSSGANGSDAGTAPGASVPSSGPSGTPRALYIQKSRAAFPIVFVAGPGPSLALTPQQCGPYPLNP